MNQTQIILDDYLHKYQKFVAVFFFITCCFGAINNLTNAVDFITLLSGLVFLILAVILSIIAFGRKALSISRGNLYRGITIADKMLLKERIDLSNYSKYNFVKKQKTNLPWILEYSGLGIFSNYHECLVYLVKLDSKSKKLLISMSEYYMSKDVREFLEKWTELKESDSVESTNSG